MKSAGTPSNRLGRLIADFACVVVQKRADIAIYFREEKSLPPEVRNKSMAFVRSLTAYSEKSFRTG